MFLLYKQTQSTRTEAVLNVEMIKLGTRQECIKALKEQYHYDHFIEIQPEKIEQAFNEGALFFDYSESDYYKIREV